MSRFAWLVHHRFRSLTRREYDWLFVFDGDVSLVATCLWRLLETSRIRFTSQDDGERFGLPAPVDAAAEVSGRLTNATVEAVVLHEGVLDLEIQFDTGHVLQVIPESSGYEAWTLCDGHKQFIAVGGGELAVVGNPPTGS